MIFSTRLAGVIVPEFCVFFFLFCSFVFCTLFHQTKEATRDYHGRERSPGGKHPPRQLRSGALRCRDSLLLPPIFYIVQASYHTDFDSTYRVRPLSLELL